MLDGKPRQVRKEATVVIDACAGVWLMGLPPNYHSRHPLGKRGSPCMLFARRGDFLMTYQVLARKYRPHNFQEMAGQEHVLRALINAFEQKRLHHAYLFTGTRGVGKTTLARIIAKCLNCETGITSQPCNQCNICLDIDQGRFIDLLEIDAASRTKVEDTRELLENVQYAPSRGRYKVYLIDEVHMLSTHSFNALLKTLEEPPPHVKFLLATTDPQRLPVTILSRCLQFNLKNLSVEQIKKQLEYVLKQENIIFEDTALACLARAANGSARDALSLLDQAIAYGGGQVKTDDVKTMLGSIEQTYILQLLTALTERNPKTVLTTIEQLAEHTADFSSALEDLLSLLHRLAIMQAVPDANNTHSENHEQLTKFAQQLSPEDVQLFYQIGLIGRRDLPLAPNPRDGFEMVLLRMLAFRPVDITESTVETQFITPSSDTQETPKQDVINRVSATTPLNNTANHASTTTHSNSWSDIVPQLGLTGFALVLANHCTVKEQTADEFHLLLDPSQIAMRSPKQEARLAEALSQYLGRPIALQINVASTPIATPASQKTAQQAQQLQNATQIVENDAKVQTLLKAFDATIQPGSIQAKNFES